MSLSQRTPEEIQEFQREIRKTLRFVLAAQEETWGFFIFRTVYIPESDTQFPLFLGALDSSIKEEVDRDLKPIGPRFDRNGQLIEETLPDPAPNAEMWRRYKNEIVEDKTKLNGATVEQVRQEFKACLLAQGVNLEEWHGFAKYRVCIMFDEEVLQSVMRRVENPTTTDYLKVWVKVVEFTGAQKDESWEHEYSSAGGSGVDELDGEEVYWQGWLKVELGSLFGVWTDIAADGEVEDMWASSMGSDGVYCA